MRKIGPLEIAEHRIRTFMDRYEDLALALALELELELELALGRDGVTRRRYA
jgi:hypothetical protein